MLVMTKNISDNFNDPTVTNSDAPAEQEHLDLVELAREATARGDYELADQLLGQSIAEIDEQLDRTSKTIMQMYDLRVALASLAGRSAPVMDTQVASAASYIVMKSQRALDDSARPKFPTP